MELLQIFNKDYGSTKTMAGSYSVTQVKLESDLQRENMKEREQEKKER